MGCDMNDLGTAAILDVGGDGFDLHGCWTCTHCRQTQRFRSSDPLARPMVE